MNLKHELHFRAYNYPVTCQQVLQIFNKSNGSICLTDTLILQSRFWQLMSLILLTWRLTLEYGVIKSSKITEYQAAMVNLARSLRSATCIQQNGIYHVNAIL